MDRPDLPALDTLPGLTRDELRLFPNQGGYHVYLGFGQDTVEYQVTPEGSFERLERSGPSMASHRYELIDLPAAARQAVAAIAADYRATRADADGPTL